MANKPKTIQLTDREAIEYICFRAENERRSLANTLAVAVLESANHRQLDSFRDRVNNKGNNSHE